MTDVRPGFDALATEIHAWARSKGFYDRERLPAANSAAGPYRDWLTVGDSIANPSLPAEKLMLVVTEVAEAVEGLRNDDAANEAEEIADAIIRLLDYAAWRGISLDNEVRAKMAKNRGRPYLHGKAAF